MRQMLVTKFACASCGNLLNLTYDSPKASVPKYVESEPTGAAMVEAMFLIEPCQTCLQPAQRVREAVETLLKGGQ